MKRYGYEVLQQDDVVRVDTNSTGQLILKLLNGKWITEAPCYVLEVSMVNVDGAYSVIYRPIP